MPRSVGVARTLLAFLLLLSSALHHPPSLHAEDMIAVSADIVEIGGSVQRDLGVNWNDFVDFAEKSIPGIFRVDDFARLTALQSSIRALQNEGKAQILSNPKIVTKNSTSASFLVGGEIPIQIVGATGSVGFDFKKFGVLLNILPVLDDKTKKSAAQIQLEVSNPDFSQSVNGVPSIISRQIQTEVEVKSGETIVIGGLKSSEKQTNLKRVPVLGHIPLIGLLFRLRKTIQNEKTLFLFVTLETLKS